MKKFLIGIVTLVAAVMLSSSAFGAWADYDPFEFYNEDGILLTAGKDYFSLDLRVEGATSSPDSFPGVINDVWGTGLVGNTPDQLYEYGDPPTVFEQAFVPPVEIVTLKGGQEAWAFWMQNDFAAKVVWDSDLRPAMSNIRGFNEVPIPAAVWLLGSGVLGLVAIRRRRS